MTIGDELLQMIEKMSETVNSGDASDSGSGNSSEWANTPTVQSTAPEGCRDDTGAV